MIRSETCAATPPIPPQLLRILHLEDNPRDAELVREQIAAGGLSCELVVVNSRETFEAALADVDCQLILCDHNIPGYHGHAALQLALQRQPCVPVIVIAGTLGEDEAVNCLHLGAADYVLKQRPQRLVPAVQRALQQSRLKRELEQSEQQLRDLNVDLEQRVTQRTAELFAAKNTAERANRAKDSFLATMSHEIRTPLGGLTGMLELLGFTALNEEQREVLQAARDSGRSLLRIVNDILDWSKIEAGQLQLAPYPTSITQLVADVVNTYARLASANSIVLLQYVDARVGPAHEVDALRLSQVLHNFLSNAIKFSKGGDVELRAELLAPLDGAEELRFSVSDTGIGIAKEHRQRLFQDYGQMSSDTARLYGGTGLGLSISRRLAELLGGRLDVESEPGMGSTFSITLTLPVAVAAVQPRQGPLPAAAPVRSQLRDAGEQAKVLQVLVVDDHPVNRRLMVLQLSVLGLHGTSAHDGATALAKWRDGAFDAVITDCHMPGMDGYELTRAIRGIEADEARPRTPVFAWTANALEEEKDKCNTAGMDALLVKPSELAQLQQLLLKWLPATAAVGDPNMAQPEPVAGAAPASMVPALDLRVLQALVGSDPGVVREFLLDFRTSAVRIATQMKTACEQRDTKQAVALAHKLKSSALAVGALALGELCVKIEQAGSVADHDATDALLPRFEAEMANVETYLDTLQNQSG